MTRILLTLSLTILIACAPRGTVTLSPQAGMIGQVEPIFVATTRAQDQDGSFSSKRSEQVHFARYDISVPPDLSDHRSSGLPDRRGLPVRLAR
jgi:esterase/lipase superfamily enzyme